MERYDSVLEEIIQVIDEYDRVQQNEGYNIFKVLEIETDEVKLCRVLADLLNPAGTHHKGTKYLKLFVKNILGYHDISEEELDGAYVYKEYLIKGERRSDIVIETTQRFIPIEVKINVHKAKKIILKIKCQMKKCIVFLLKRISECGWNKFFKQKKVLCV